MPRRVRPALQTIPDAIEGIENAARRKTLEDFAADWLIRHATRRGIEIASEAARRIPPDPQASQPQVPWAQITGIGNISRHEYHRVSDTVVWNVVMTHLPSLKSAVTAIAASLDEV